MRANRQEPKLGGKRREGDMLLNLMQLGKGSPVNELFVSIDSVVGGETQQP